jgi:hypothetical protein
MAKRAITQEGMVWRIILTILIPALLLIGAFVYVAFYANGYDLFQKIVIVVVALIASGAIISILWVTWAGGKGLIKVQ